MDFPFPARDKVKIDTRVLDLESNIHFAALSYRH